MDFSILCQVKGPVQSQFLCFVECWVWPTSNSAFIKGTSVLNDQLIIIILSKEIDKTNCKFKLMHSLLFTLFWWINSSIFELYTNITYVICDSGCGLIPFVIYIHHFRCRLHLSILNFCFYYLVLLFSNF